MDRKALEPYVKLAPFVGVGLVIVAIAVAAMFYTQRGGHMELVGTIQKVRTLALDEKSSAAIIDFRVENPADYRWVVRQTSISMTNAKGQVLEGMSISDVDARRLFEYFPALGQKYNSSLLADTTIAPHATLDRMLAARFEVPESELQQRKNLDIRIEDRAGSVSDILERK
jgi:hypothetical protein